MTKRKNNKDPDELTYKERRFVEELLVDWNITRAASEVGYKCPKTNGWEVFKRDKVQNAIQKALKKQQERTQITADRALEEIARIAFADLRQAFDEDGNLKAIKDMPEDVARAVASTKVISSEEGTSTKEVKFWDKVRALEQIGKHFKMFTERQEHTGKDGGPIQFEGMDDTEAATKLASILSKAEQRMEEDKGGDEQ